MHIVRSKRKALTLVELITVTMIIAVVAGAGTLSLATLDGKRLETDARKLIGNLSFAREMAMNTRQNYIVDFDPATSTYRIYRGSIASANEVSRQYLHTTLTSVVPSTQVTFVYPLGTSTDTTITLTLNGKTSQVVIFGATGYVRMQ